MARELKVNVHLTDPDTGESGWYGPDYPNKNAPDGVEITNEAVFADPDDADSDVVPGPGQSVPFDPESAEAEAKAKAEAGASGGGMSAGDDPADYTVAEVNAYLATADDDEHERVLDAEVAGKNRTGITG